MKWQEHFYDENGFLAGGQTVAQLLKLDINEQLVRKVEYLMAVNRWSEAQTGKSARKNVWADS